MTDDFIRAVRRLPDKPFDDVLYYDPGRPTPAPIATPSHRARLALAGIVALAAFAAAWIGFAGLAALSLSVAAAAVGGVTLGVAAGLALWRGLEWATTDRPARPFIA